MNINFHTHTKRCHHAKGEDKEYVEAAIKEGFSVLGFSDHSPYWFPGDYYSNFRMKPGEMEEYFQSILSLKAEYKDDIEIYVGFEAEYYPKYFEKFLDMIAPYPYDYLILGQHFIRNEIDGVSMMQPCRRRETLASYVDECIEGIRTGKFFYLAHPDMINFIGDAKIYEYEMRRLCDAACRKNIPLELNLLGFRDSRNYPCELFWKIAGEIGNSVILGSDAHSPRAFADKKDVAQADLFVGKYRLQIIEPTSPF